MHWYEDLPNFGDHRYSARRTGERNRKIFNERNMHFEIELEDITEEQYEILKDIAEEAFPPDDDGYGVAVVKIPVKYEVCETCDGRGTHTNPSIDDRGISAEEFYEDPDFAESYFSGHYDVSCYECGGERVSPQIVEVGKDQNGNSLNPALDLAIQLYYEMLEAEAATRREYEAERRMGA